MKKSADTSENNKRNSLRVKRGSMNSSTSNHSRNSLDEIEDDLIKRTPTPFENKETTEERLVLILIARYLGSNNLEAAKSSYQGLLINGNTAFDVFKCGAHSEDVGITLEDCIAVMQRAIASKNIEAVKWIIENADEAFIGHCLGDKLVADYLSLALVGGKLADIKGDNVANNIATIQQKQMELGIGMTRNSLYLNNLAQRIAESLTPNRFSLPKNLNQLSLGGGFKKLDENTYVEKLKTGEGEKGSRAKSPPPPSRSITHVEQLKRKDKSLNVLEGIEF